ncbi:MAG: STAS domain-containing protein [Vulcanimicrobiaceae bacterium]
MVRVRDRNGIPLIEVSGDVDVFSVDEVFTSVREAVTAGKPFVLSFEECSYCDSSGISSVIALIKERQRFAIVANGTVRRVMETTKLHTLVPVVSDVDEALKRLQP